MPICSKRCHAPLQTAIWLSKPAGPAGLHSFELMSPLTLQEEEAFDSYVLISQQDALEAMGCFVAAYLATLPDAQKMEPQELQKALVNSFKVSSPPCGLGCSAYVCRVLASSA